MDSLIAIGAGLGLRALIDSVAHQTVQATALVGLWEGIVLNHFLGKFPSSLDPYLAFVFRLAVDFIFTESLTRMTIIVLWTVLGMLLADVAVQMSVDRRFRRLWRRTKRMVSRSSSGISPSPGSSRVRFFEIPGSSSTTGSQNATALRSSSSSNGNVQFLRPTATPFPGQFDQWSEVSAPSRLGPPATPSDSVSEMEGMSLLQPPDRPRTPSELEYLTLPVIPDAQEPGYPVAGPSSRPHIKVDITPQKPFRTRPYEPNDADDKPAANSGLTTPLSNPRSLSRHANEEDLPRAHSGLTTPEYLHAPLQAPTTDIPPSSKKAMKQPAAVRLTLAEPSPSGVKFPEPQLTPMIIPPASEIPNIPTPDDILASRPADNRTPPPSFQEAMKSDDVSSVGESVIAGKRDTIIARADELRQKAKEQEAERDRLRTEIRKAQKEKRHLDVVCLQVELEEAQESIEQLHAKAARRYYRAHNLNPAPQEIDVHRLTVEEAYSQVRKAIRDARGFGATQLRIIVGQGNHSVGKTPILKPAIISELKKIHIDATVDITNPGVLIVKLPAGQFNPAAPTPAPASKGLFF